MDPDNDFPERLIRGIYDQSMVDEDGYVKPGFLQFSTHNARSDGWIEESINWEDNEEVVPRTLAETREGGELKFRGGAAPMLFTNVHGLSKKPRVEGNFRYERNEQDENPNHGNLLVLKVAPSHIRKMIVADLALNALKVIGH